MTRKSYLDQSEAEQDERDAPLAKAAAPAELDLSSVAPTPIKRPEALREAVEEGHRRGFGSPASAVARMTGQTRRAKPPVGQSPKRLIVSHTEEPAAGLPGQITLTGDAKVFYDFARRAHYERRPRGELLTDMLRLYEEKHGPLPDDF